MSVMKPKVLRSGLCVLFLLAGCGKEAEQARQRAEKELETVRAELEATRTERTNLQNETARLRKDNEDLLRLRNEVRQLRDAAQAAQAQAAQAQAAQAAQAQALALGTNVVQALTPEQQAFARRYGLTPPTPEQQLNACLNNLRQIDAAKQQWALENRKTAETIPGAQDIAAYLKDGVPKCPAGGQAKPQAFPDVAVDVAELLKR